MKKCAFCGNEYQVPLEIKYRDNNYTFDCFECAIYALAPTCLHCGVKIIGHGHQSGAKLFCSAHCANQEGIKGLQDRQ